MRGFMALLADTFSGIVTLIGTVGIIFLILGAMVVIDAHTGNGKSAVQIFAITDAWAGKVQAAIQLGSTNFFGSFALALGAKLIAGALASAVLLDIMYSLRSLVAFSRR